MCIRDRITDVILAVNRRYRKSDYIPCILWNNNALLSRQWKVGTKVMLSGRMQSRFYNKTIDGESERRIAYEISVRDCLFEDNRTIGSNMQYEE